jgi:hypothetical protein
VQQPRCSIPLTPFCILRKHGGKLILCLPNKPHFIGVMNFFVLSSSKFDLKSEGRKVFVRNSKSVRGIELIEDVKGNLEGSSFETIFAQHHHLQQTGLTYIHSENFLKIVLHFLLSMPPSLLLPTSLLFHPFHSYLEHFSFT